MDLDQVQARRAARARDRRARARRRRAAALGAVAVVVALTAVIVIASSGGGDTSRIAASGRRDVRASHRGRGAGRGAAATRKGHDGSTVTGTATGRPGMTPVPILTYHVIAPPPPGAPFPGLYVPADEFAAQMAALKSAGWHPVTLDQLQAFWSRGVPLGHGKPVVLTFDNGYHSQYANALPVLKRLGWVADENIQLSGLPPSQGGLTDPEVRALIAAGWELDTQGISHADLVTLDAGSLHYQVATARQILRQRYGVPVNWFCYPSGHYNATVIAAVRAAGFVGSTTTIPGIASPANDPYRLPRLRVLAGTSGPALLAEIDSAHGDSLPPASYGEPGTT
jgi:peptidoglycan/xylan/chitin deacetylase (PgdA/CDA1 family)